MQVHAHPDDEASKGAGVAAKYAADGVRTVLVTCTGGEAGEILNPAMDTPEIREALFEQRMRELDDSVAALKYAKLHLLGYRDSGMPDTEPNRDPQNFWNAPLEESVGKLVAIIRAERPQVVLTYGEDHSGYPHPDHIRTHEIAVAAFDAAGDASRYPEAGPPFQPLKLYYTGWMMARMRTIHDAIVAAGKESPYDKWLGDDRPDLDDRFTTRIDVGDYLDQARDALLAHKTQVAPDSFWFALDTDAMRTVWPWENFVLARSLVDAGGSVDMPETDLFAGIPS